LQGKSCVIATLQKTGSKLLRKREMSGMKTDGDRLKFGKERYYYEGLFNKRACDTKWWVVRKHLKQMNLDVTEKNLLIYYNISQSLKKGVSRLVENYSLIVKYGTPIRNSQRWTGKQFKQYLIALDLMPKYFSTFTRWFNVLNGYKKEESYQYQELFLVLAKAVIYKNKKEFK
jgi:hypothetical protein